MSVSLGTRLGGSGIDSRKMFILHAHVKSINATVMGTQNFCRGEVEQHLGPERRSGSRTVSGMNSHKADRNGCHAEKWLVWTETAMLSAEAWNIWVYTVYLCASKWRRACIKKVGLVQSQCRYRSVVEVRICHVTRKSLSIDTGIM